MSEAPEDIKRWTARRETSAVMDIIKIRKCFAFIPEMPKLFTKMTSSPWNGSEADINRSERDMPTGRHIRQKEVWRVARDILREAIPDTNL